MRSVEKKLTAAADEVREHSAGQTELWQQFPLLGLLRYGNGGYSFQDRILYEGGVIRVNDSQNAAGKFGTYVDCADGSIQEHNGGSSVKPANDKQIVHAWLSSDGGAFDAQARLEQLRSDAAYPRGAADASLELLTKRRLTIARQLGLRVMYSRDEQLKHEELDTDTIAAISYVDLSTGKRVGF